MPEYIMISRRTKLSLLPWPDEGHPFVVLALRCVERNNVAAASYLLRLSEVAGGMIASQAALRNPNLLTCLVNKGYRVRFGDLLDLLTEDHVSVFERLKGISPPEPDKVYWTIFHNRLSDDALIKKMLRIFAHSTVCSPTGYGFAASLDQHSCALRLRRSPIPPRGGLMGCTLLSVQKCVAFFLISRRLQDLADVLDLDNTAVS